MRDFDDLLPQVIPFAPGCAEPTAILHLRRAFKRLCERTRCWRATDTFETSGLNEDILCVPACACLYEIEFAKFNDMDLERRPFGPDMMFHDNGLPRYITQSSPNTVRLDPYTRGSLYLSMFLVPSQHAEGMPAGLMERFGDAIGEGALSTLLLIPNQPFSNPQLASYYQSKFDAVLDTNFAYNVRGQQRATARTRARFL